MWADSMSIFDPAAPPAESIRDLALVVLVITGLIFVLVESVLVYSILRFRHKPTAPGTEPPQVYGSKAIEIAWTAAPGLIVFILVLVVARTEWEVRPATPQPKPGDNALFVTVVGRQFWWEFRYDHFNGEKLNFITANELHIPASDPGETGTPRPVYLRLVSADVCHSFWVPRLGGKTDLIPGRVNQMFLQTAERGMYLGHCAEFCGTQHATMLLRVHVDAPGDFEQWAKKQQPPAKAPTQEKAQQGHAVFLGQSCVNCHRVRGTPAQGTYGPDLTHLMSRQTIASCLVPNDLKNLRQWVKDPQALRPGCLMPAFGLSDADADLIVDYLRTLD